MSFVVALAALACLVAFVRPLPGHADGLTAAYVTEIPQGYRDWKWISSAHEAGNLNSLGAALANDIAFKALRKESTPSLMAQRLPHCITNMSRRTKTTRSLARRNLSFPALPRTFRSWSRTQQSTPRPVVGGLVISKKANLLTRHS